MLPGRSQTRRLRSVVYPAVIHHCSIHSRIDWLLAKVAGINIITHAAPATKLLRPRPRPPRELPEGNVCRRLLLLLVLGLVLLLLFLLLLILLVLLLYLGVAFIVVIIAVIIVISAIIVITIIVILVKC